jgi:hypothetical protein
MHYSELFIQEVLSAGARGYLFKSDATRNLYQLSMPLRHTVRTLRIE